MAPKSEDEAREIARKLLEEAEFRREEAKARGEVFESLDEEALVKKIMGGTANSPFFSSQSVGSGTPGGTAGYTASIHNPDPTGFSALLLFGYLFFGPSNFIQDRDIALTMVDTRFPRFFQGITVVANGNVSSAFTINIPSGITPGVYIGNCFLVLRNPLGVGTVFDRAGFRLPVT